jgi:hypothetical protein
MYCLFCDVPLLFVCIRVLNNCQRVATQLQLNISYHINELKRATDKSNKEYLDSICDKIMEFQRTGCYDFTYTKAKN